MSHKPASISWRIKCKSTQESDRIAELARAEVALGRTLKSVHRGFPNGIEVAIVKEHQISNYFDRIDVLTGQQPDRPVFYLIFQPRMDASSYWKDIMARILQSICDAGKSVSITVEQPDQSESSAPSPLCNKRPHDA